jgi:ketosteroid isomerase-like protein
MDEAAAFLDDVLPRLRDEVLALENGDAGPRKGLWSHHDPVTLFGAEASASGWEQVEPIFDRLAESFSQGPSCTHDVLGAGVSGDLGYVVAIERSVAGTGGSPPRTFTLRVTTIFRCEQGDWKVIHRHGDPYDITSREALNRRRQQGVM